jgi:hypothetical protein
MADGTQFGVQSVNKQYPKKFTSVRNYHSTRRKIPEKLRSHLRYGGSQKSRKENISFGGS